MILHTVIIIKKHFEYGDKNIKNALKKSVKSLLKEEAF